jgi:hypothetical protein
MLNDLLQNYEILSSFDLLNLTFILDDKKYSELIIMKLLLLFIMYNQNLLMLITFLIKEVIKEIMPFFFLISLIVLINPMQINNTIVKEQRLKFELVEHP